MISASSNPDGIFGRRYFPIS